MMRITIERELRPGVTKRTVVQVRNAGGGKAAVLGSVAGMPDVPGTLVFIDKPKGSSYSIALQALRALAGDVPAHHAAVEQELSDG